MTAATFHPRPGAVKAMRFEGTSESVLALAAWVNVRGTVDDEDGLPFRHTSETGVDGSPTFIGLLSTRHGDLALEAGDWVVDLGGDLGLDRIDEDDFDQLYGPDPGYLTADEHDLMDLLEAALSFYGRVVCETDTARRPNVAEFALPIHALQNQVLARAASRAYPDRYTRAATATVRTDPLVDDDVVDAEVLDDEPGPT